MKRFALVTCLGGQQIGRLRVSQIFFDGGTRRVHAHFVKENHGARGPKVDKIDIGIGVGDLESGLNDTQLDIGKGTGSSRLQGNGEGSSGTPTGGGVG
jgi:hypothetical protein